VKVEVGFKF